MRLRLSIVCFLFIAALGKAQNAAGPATAAETVIRTETRVVLVDAVAVDKKNKFARDLTRKDFRIREDGREQKIDSFSLESAGVSPERSSKHYIMLFFDTSTLGPSTLLAVRRDAIRFVDTFASADRYIAVIAYGGTSQILQNFTSDPARVKDALDKLQNFSTNTAGGATPGAPGRFIAGAPGAPLDASAYRRMLASLRTVADSVAEIRGRKALVLFSGGVDANADISTDVAATIDACNKANVAVYGVNGHGLIGELDMPGSKKSNSELGLLRRGILHTLQGVTSEGAFGGEALGFQRGGGGAIANTRQGSGSIVDASGSQLNTSTANQDVLRALADGTGGLMLGTSNDLPDALGRIVQEQDEYYLLGYTPSPESAEGTCHKLQVKVDRSGLDIRARKGYCTEKPMDPLAGKQAGKDLEARAASGVTGNIAVRAQLPWFYSGANVARVGVALDIVPAADVKDSLHGEFDLAGIAYKSDGSVAARFSDTVQLDYDTQRHAHYSNQFEIAPGQYNFRIAVSSGAQGFGKIDVPLTIDPWNGKTLSISALALSHDAHPVAPDLAAGVDDLLLERVRPLIAKGMEVIPAGTTQFRVGEQGAFYFEIYDPAVGPAISVRIRILDRATGSQIDDSGPLKVDSFIRRGNPIIPIVMKLPIVSAGLPAGAYKVEASATDGQTQGPIVRTADFDVN